MRSAFKICALALTCASATDPRASFNPQDQVGPNPPLPEPQQFLFPPMRLSKIVGWKEGEKPTVAQGLKIEALATDLQHPRSLYVLPNGDVLVVESKSPGVQPIARPKDLIMGWIESMVTSGGDTGPSNRITLLRYGDDGKPQTRTVFLDHLNSPFGVALVGQDLYVANTDAIVRYPYKEGQTTIADEGTKVTDLPGGPIYLIAILKGACFFLADLARAMKTPARIEFIGISSYGKGKSSSGEVKLTKDLDVSIEGYDVIVVEDIVDSGITLSYLMQLLQQRKPKSLRVASLLDKPEHRQRPVEVAYRGFEIPDEFVVGYGLDYAEDYRNLPDICVLSDI